MLSDWDLRSILYQAEKHFALDLFLNVEQSFNISFNNLLDSRVPQLSFKDVFVFNFVNDSIYIYRAREREREINYCWDSGCDYLLSTREDDAIATNVCFFFGFLSYL